VSAGLPAGEARRIAFHQRFALVHIEGPPLRPFARATWRDAGTREVRIVEENDLDLLMTRLELLEAEGCTFGMPADLAVLLGWGQG
jgi:hypothetical protein